MELTKYLIRYSIQQLVFLLTLTPVFVAVIVYIVIYCSVLIITIETGKMKAKKITLLASPKQKSEKVMMM